MNQRKISHPDHIFLCIPKFLFLSYIFEIMSAELFIRIHIIIVKTKVEAIACFLQNVNLYDFLDLEHKSKE